MDNPQQLSTVEVTNEPPMSRNSGIEWGTMAIGCMTGLVWEVAERFGLALLRYAVDQYNPAQFPTWIFSVFLLASALAGATLVGFIVGYRARHHQYRFTTVVFLVLFVIIFSFNQWALSQIPNAPPTNLFRVATFQMLYLIVALNGVYLAQSVKRNRGVRIQ